MTTKDVFMETMKDLWYPFTMIGICTLFGLGLVGATIGITSSLEGYAAAKADDVYEKTRERLWKKKEK